MSITELGKKLFELKASKEQTEAALTEINKRITDTVAQLAKKMEDGEIPKFSIDGHGTLTLGTELYVNVKADDREKLHDWLRATKNEALIKETVNPKTLQAFAKEQIANMKALPDFISALPSPTVRTRKA